MDQDQKVRENRLRRMAARQGYKLVRTRRLDHRALDYGTYKLVRIEGCGPAEDPAARLLTIDEVADFLTRSPRDAAEVIDELKPPEYQVAAPYLREIAHHVMREAGIDGDFLQALIRGRPLAFPPTGG